MTSHSAPSGGDPPSSTTRLCVYTNATAFSPSDTLPLSATVKLLMAVQSLTALVRPSSWWRAP